MLLLKQISVALRITRFLSAVGRFLGGVQRQDGGHLNEHNPVECSFINTQSNSMNQNLRLKHEEELSYKRLWTFVGSVPCSRVLRLWSENIPAPLLLPAHVPVFGREPGLEPETQSSPLQSANSYRLRWHLLSLSCIEAYETSQRFKVKQMCRFWFWPNLGFLIGLFILITLFGLVKWCGCTMGSKSNKTSRQVNVLRVVCFKRMEETTGRREKQLEKPEASGSGPESTARLAGARPQRRSRLCP